MNNLENQLKAMNEATEALKKVERAKELLRDMRATIETLAVEINDVFSSFKNAARELEKDFEKKPDLTSQLTSDFSTRSEHGL